MKTKLSSKIRILLALLIIICAVVFLLIWQIKRKDNAPRYASVYYSFETPGIKEKIISSLVHNPQYFPALKSPDERKKEISAYLNSDLEGNVITYSNNKPEIEHKKKGNPNKTELCFNELNIRTKWKCKIANNSQPSAPLEPASASAWLSIASIGYFQGATASQLKLAGTKQNYVIKRKYLSDKNSLTYWPFKFYVSRTAMFKLPVDEPKLNLEGVSLRFWDNFSRNNLHYETVSHKRLLTQLKPGDLLYDDGTKIKVDKVRLFELEKQSYISFKPSYSAPGITIKVEQGGKTYTRPDPDSRSNYLGEPIIGLSETSPINIKIIVGKSIPLHQQSFVLKPIKE